jgi:hypothetical protein
MSTPPEQWESVESQLPEGENPTFCDDCQDGPLKVWWSNGAESICDDCYVDFRAPLAD